MIKPILLVTAWLTVKTWKFRKSPRSQLIGPNNHTKTQMNFQNLMRKTVFFLPEPALAALLNAVHNSIFEMRNFFGFSLSELLVSIINA